MATNRVTQKDLENLVLAINENAGTPKVYYNRETKSINIGNYHLDYAYGGVRLVRTVNEHGGISVVSTTGFGTKRELYNWMQAFLAGMVY